MPFPQALLPGPVRDPLSPAARGAGHRGCRSFLSFPLIHAPTCCLLILQSRALMLLGNGRLQNSRQQRRTQFTPSRFAERSGRCRHCPRSHDGVLWLPPQHSPSHGSSVPGPPPPPQLGAPDTSFTFLATWPWAGDPDPARWNLLEGFQKAEVVLGNSLLSGEKRPG